MPLSLPNLDDRTFDDLVEEALRLIPTCAPEWTNYNPSDPGITLIELFAYLTEMLIYRLNRVTEANQYAFLKLLNGPGWKPAPNQSLSDAIQDTMKQLRESDRAVTEADFERLALEADGRVGRAHCLRRRVPPTFNADSPGNMSVLIVPKKKPNGKSETPEAIAQILDKVKADLEERRLLTTKVHVVSPTYCEIRVQLTLVLKPDVLEAKVKRKAIRKLRRFFNPLRGGTNEKGWTFGRSVYISEIYDLLDRQPGVDYVTPTLVGQEPNVQKLEEIILVNSADTSRRQLNTQGQLIGLTLYPHELVKATIQDTDIQTIVPKLV
jgi:hypothetical protein